MIFCIPFVCHSRAVFCTLHCAPSSLKFVGCFASQQHVSVSQGRICSDKYTCCHTEIEVADQALIQSQDTDTGLTSASADPMTPGGVATGVSIFKSTRPGTPPPPIPPAPLPFPLLPPPRAKTGIEPQSAALEADAVNHQANEAVRFTDKTKKRVTVNPRLEITVPVGWALNTNN